MAKNDDLEKVWEDIERARQYMLNRFPVYVNEEKTPTGVFGQPRFEVVFPDVDTCRVVPVMLFGMRVEEGACLYRLA